MALKQSVMEAQGSAHLDDEGAAAFALLLGMMRGAGAVGTTALECRSITAAVLVDIQKVCAIDATPVARTAVESEPRQAWVCQEHQCDSARSWCKTRGPQMVAQWRCL